MANLTLGYDTTGLVISISSNNATYMSHWENFKARNGQAFAAYSNGTVSFMAVTLQNDISFNNVVGLFSESNAGSATIQFGLYSRNVSTLSRANSASLAITMGNALNWHSFVTSAQQDITPGQWYWGINVLSGGASSLSMLVNSSINPSNAFPGSTPIFARMTVSTNAMPASVAISDLNETGSSAVRYPYIIITA